MTASSPPVSAAAPRFAALHVRDFRWFFLLSLTAMTADNIEHVISYWVIYQAFHSPMLAGFAVISHWMPFLLFSVYAGALAVIFPPYDEDFGYVTLEAFLSGKPVITTTDAGGPNEFVVDGVNGFVVAAEAAALGDAIARLDGNRPRAASFGDAGLTRARAITWSGVIERLLG